MGKIQELEEELTRLRKEQITDIYATFNTRLDRHCRIKLIKHLLNICAYIHK